MFKHSACRGQSANGKKLRGANRKGEMGRNIYKYVFNKRAEFGSVSDPAMGIFLCGPLKEE